MIKKIRLSETFLNELNLSQKNLNKFIGHGDYQYAFYSSDPKKIIKFGRNHLSDSIKKADKEPKDFVKRKYNENELYQFVEMQKYPQYFVKVYKITKEYVVTERLNTSLAKTQFLNINSFLKENYNISFADMLSEFASVNGRITDMMKIFYEAYNKLQKKLSSDLIKSCKQFMKLILNITNLKLFEIDINSGNFGYDDKGILKMLDV